MSGPATYAEWAELLRRFEEGGDDAATLAQLEGSKLPSGEGVDGRIYKRIVSAFEVRVKRVAEDVTKRLMRGIDEVGYVQMVAAARRALQPIAAFTHASCWRPEVGTKMSEALEGFVSRTQAAFEASAAERAHVDQGIQLAMVRRSPFTLNVPDAAALPGNPQPASQPQAGGTPAGPPPTRRIIF